MQIRYFQSIVIKSRQVKSNNFIDSLNTLTICLIEKKILNGKLDLTNKSHAVLFNIHLIFLIGKNITIEKAIEILKKSNKFLNLKNTNKYAVYFLKNVRCFFTL